MRLLRSSLLRPYISHRGATLRWLSQSLSPPQLQLQLLLSSGYNAIMSSSVLTSSSSSSLARCRHFYPPRSSILRRCRRGHSTYPLNDARWNTASSSSETEVDKFNKVGEDWWDENSASGTGPLHAMNPARVTFIRNCISAKLNRSDMPFHKQIKGLRILDVGCGGGLLSESLSRLGAFVTGIDLAPRSIEVAKRHSQLDRLTQNINYRLISVQDLANNSEKFDVVCCLEVLEHVDNKADFIANLAKCTEEGGSIFMSTMNRTKKAYVVAIAGAEYVARLLPPGTHDWNSFVTTEEMRIFLQKAGTSVVDMNGIVIDMDKFKRFSKPSLQFKLSENDLDVNYIMHAVKRKSES